MFWGEGQVYDGEHDVKQLKDSMVKVGRGVKKEEHVGGRGRGNYMF